MMIKQIFTTLFGKISWTTPSWLQSLCRQTTERPKAALAYAVGILVVIGTLLYGYHWYANRPQPEWVSAQIIIPKITPLDQTLVPDNLMINFGVMQNNQLSARSVAPLQLVGKTIIKDVTITPAMPGSWQWENDSQLVFTPANDWPAEQTYTIHFDKPFFASRAKMATYTYTFTTLPFAATINHFELYINPVNPRLRQAVAELDFNFPVDAASVERRIALQWQSSTQPIKYSLKWDEHKRIAYFKSEMLPLPDAQRYLTLTLDKGIQSSTGSGKLQTPVTNKILVADASSYFKVVKLGTQIVRNQKDQPEQILSLETNLGITQADLNQVLHVYVLPRNKPATLGEAEKQDYAWENPGEVTPDILQKATPLTLNTIPADRDYATLHSFRYQVATPAYLYVKIDKGAHGMGDFNLAEPYATVLPVPEYPKEISFLHRGSLLALGTEEKLSVMVRGLPAVKFTIARVLPRDINHLVTQTEGDFNNPVFRDYSFNESNISEISSEVQTFNASDQAKQQYTALDLSHYMQAKNNNAGSLGLFLLTAQSWNAKDNVPTGEAQAKRLILITNLGIISKDNQDGSHDVFVESITAGKPAVNVAVSILGKNGLPIVTRTTDATGRAIFPNLKDFTDEREPTVYVARNGNDIAFMPFNHADRQLNYSRFDIGGVMNDASNQSALTAYIFTDRGIYRPGDTAHIAMIIKQPYVVAETAGLPLEATVVDPRGTTVKTEKFNLNETGYTTFDFQPGVTAPTGQYQLYLNIVKDNHPSSLIGNAAFNVQEFLPDRMRIGAAFSDPVTKGWLSPSGLRDTVSLTNLYGAPAADHKVSGKIILTPKAIHFAELPDYVFMDPLLNPKSPPKVFSEALTETKTNANGHAEFALNLERFEKATYELNVYTEGFEAAGGRSVTTRQTALISPLEYLVGYKTDGDLSYIKQQSARHVNFIAVNPELTNVALPDLKIHLYSLRPVTTLVKNPNDTYEYKSVVQSSEVSSEALTIAAAGTDYALPAKDIGDYQLVVTDKNDTELARFNYSVVGESARPLPKNAELSVKLNKAEYQPGEEIEMQITAPYTGSGLITIERDKVYAAQWFTTQSVNSIQKIKLPADFKGNGYINIAFVRDLNSPDIFMSPLSYSVQPFAVTHQAETLNVQLKTASLARPGEPLAIQYSSDKPGKIIVFAVDEGILQVARYLTPDPLQYFFQKRALNVDTFQIVDQILPKYIAQRELSSVGGDEGEAALAKNLNPFKRKTEAPVVYWSGIIDADSHTRELVYKVPDYFNGTLRVMAVGVAQNAVGSAAATSIVRGAFVINPNVPTFVAPGDEFEVTASIANNVEHSGDAAVKVQLAVSHEMTIVGEQSATLTIPEGKERSVHFTVRANERLGSAALTFTAAMGDKSSKITSTLSVRPATVFTSSVMSGYAKDGKTTLDLKHEFYPAYQQVHAAVSTSPLILVTGLQRYLDDYPYGCVEQLVSKAMPWLALANQPWTGNHAASIQEKIQQTIQMLSQRQMTNGGFSYWPEVHAENNDPFYSIYAMHFLLEAKLQGYRVPENTYAQGLSYLKEIAARDVNDLAEARLTAYAIYILTRNEIVTTNDVTNLQLTLNQTKKYDWQHDITSAYLASTYQLLKSHQEAEKLIDKYQPQSQQNSEGDFYNGNIADAQYLYLIALHFPDRLNKLTDSLMPKLVAALNDETMSTILSGYTTLALSAYDRVLKTPAAEEVSLAEILDGKENALTSSSAGYQNAAVSEGAKQVVLNSAGQDGYFYQLTQAGFDSHLSKAVVNDGIEVVREYTTDDNAAIGEQVGLGDNITVHLRARATDNKYHSNVALVDLLPGGFEVNRATIKADYVDYSDVREDRVIFFGGIAPDSQEITYQIKATNIGTYTVPPVFGKSMYNPIIKSVGLGSRIQVK